MVWRGRGHWLVECSLGRRDGRPCQEAAAGGLDFPTLMAGDNRLRVFNGRSRRVGERARENSVCRCAEKAAWLPDVTRRSAQSAKVIRPVASVVGDAASQAKPHQTRHR